MDHNKCNNSGQHHKLQPDKEVKEHLFKKQYYNHKEEVVKLF